MCSSCRSYINLVIFSETNKIILLEIILDEQFKSFEQKQNQQQQQNKKKKKQNKKKKHLNSKVELVKDEYSE